jgi:hypothetical protein
MYQKVTVSIVFLVLLLLSLVFAQNQNDKEAPTKKSALILKDSTRLEIAVSRLIRDTLTKLGYNVKEVDLVNVGKENASLYNLSIIFSAINPGKEVDPRIQKYIEAKSDTSSKVILYTVYGSVHKKGKENVDAASQATKALHPQIIANHILKSLKP